MSDKTDSAKKAPLLSKTRAISLAFVLALAGPLLAYAGLTAGWLWLAIAGVGLVSLAMLFSALQA